MTSGGLVKYSGLIPDPRLDNTDETIALLDTQLFALLPELLQRPHNIPAAYLTDQTAVFDHRVTMKALPEK